MVVALALLIFLAQTSPAVSKPDDQANIPEPKTRELAFSYDIMTGLFIDPAARFLDMPRHYRNVTHKPKQAENVTALDEVNNSSWFTNRNFYTPMAPTQFFEGIPGESPPDDGPWTITKCKVDGITLGFQIKDRKGDAYLLKFDSPQYPELASAADVIGSRLLYAAGYNVPANYIVYFDPRILHTKSQLKCKGHDGEEFAITDAAISHLLEDQPRSKNQLVRGMASKFLPGKIKGPFSFRGVRDDDPNDRIPHEHRRELRGLGVIDAFLNNVDTKQTNTLDSYVEETGSKFLRHYLIDFGSALGSGTLEPQLAYEGHEYIFDTGEVLKSAFTLGLYRRADVRPVVVKYPSIGNIPGATFEPDQWKPHWAIPAFENMTNRDGLWGAKIVAAFTDQQIEAAVRAGQYSDPAAERELIEILKQRRDRTAKYWFRRIAPLDRFHFEGSRLVFDDLAIKANLDQLQNVHYRITPVPLDVHDEPTTVRITRTSAGWPTLSMRVVVQRINGTPTVVRIER